MSDQPPFRLPATLDLGTAEPVCRALLALPGDRPMILDGSAVESAGTPGLQVLVAAARMTAARGGTFRLADPSPALAAALADLGLADALNGAP